MIIQVETIASLLAADRDVVTEIVPSSVDQFDKKRAALLAMYRHRMIGSCDVDRWVAAMQDRLALIAPKWDAILDMVPGMEDKEGATSSYESSTTYTSEVKGEDIPDTALAYDTSFLSDRTRRSDTTESGGSVVDGLPAEIRRRRMEAEPNLWLEWAREFEHLFLRMW